MEKITKNQITKEFDKIWNRFSSELNSTGGKVEIKVPTSSPKTKHVLTIVIRLSPDLHPNIAQLTSKIQNSFPQHYYYPVSDMHFTILNCMPFLKEPNELKVTDINRISEKLEGVFQRYQSFLMTLEGLNVFPTTVFIQAFDLTGTITALRQNIHESLSSDYLHPDIEAKILVPDARLSYINIVRFQEKVSPNFVNTISEYRKINIGRFKIKRIELVTTDKLLSKHSTRAWGNYSLS